jgi:hypothetical protein
MLQLKFYPVVFSPDRCAIHNRRKKLIKKEYKSKLTLALVTYVPEASCVVVFFRAAKRVSIIIQSTNCECDVINVRSLNMFLIFYFTFRQRRGNVTIFFSLWLNWLKTRGGNSPFSPQPPYHATNRSLGKNCIDLSLLLASLSIFSPNRM